MDYLIIFACVVSIVISVMILIKIFRGEIIFKIDSYPVITSFNIEEPGYYSVWICGETLKALSLGERNVAILDSKQTKKKHLISLFKPKINGLKNGRFLLKYYLLTNGKYDFKISNECESSLGYLSKLFYAKTPFAGSSDFTYELRKTYPEFLFPFALLGIMLPIFQLLRIFE